MTEKHEIKQAIKEAFDEEIKPFYVDREEHYQDHMFIKELRGFLDNIKNTTVKVAVKTVVVAIIGACLIGFICFIWSKEYFKH